MKTARCKSSRNREARAYARAYYLEHREERIEYQRAYDKKHKKEKQSKARIKLAVARLLKLKKPSRQSADTARAAFGIVGFA